MAKPKKHPNGTWTLIASYQKARRNVTIGKVSTSEARKFAAQVDAVINHNRHGSKTLPPELLAWVQSLSEMHKTQLGELGLFDFRTNDMTVGELGRAFEADYKQRSDVSAKSTRNVSVMLRNRISKIEDVQLKDIEPTMRSVHSTAAPVFSESAKRILADFNSWQRNFYAQATWTRDNKMWRSIGLWAVKQGICQHSPFSILSLASMVNDERNVYIPAEWVLDAMESCLTPDIRITFAMGRFAGFRTCSEVRTLKWQDVDVESGTLTILDSKKKKPRVMPLFNHVRDELERQRKSTGDTRFVVSEQMRSRSSSATYQRAREAVLRSGREPWGRLLQNLRASCENDLLEIFPERQVTTWIGHTVKVSRDHYQKMRQRDCDNAIEAAKQLSPF
ncbi:Phage integrase family protein [Rosistilla carotiformis]|uniref:Phage integrase family protein n=1 Tax=Rosistilla carotiformis TaxID=2528017 RepID=A0A518JNT3_9BACT|nr:site-specific integrase [Rosistilla carotiformis]QDV67207.1 Phage integrase family protein [Rosistilla carotiformis]